MSLALPKPMRKAGSRSGGERPFCCWKDAAQKGNAENHLPVGQFYGRGQLRLPQRQHSVDMGQAKTLKGTG